MTRTWQYLAFFPGDFGPVSMTRDGATYLYVKNARGDVTHLTSSTGDVVAKYTYDPWGSPLTITDGAGNDVSSDAFHIANKNSWRYAGYYWDQESGMYYLQARYYRPDLYRFISVDPEPDENLYAYVDGNPVIAADPDGNSRVTRGGKGGLGRAVRVPITYHRHHVVPREILKSLPEAVRNNPRVRGTKGYPNRFRIPADQHLKLHRGAGGGKYNQEWKRRIQALGREPTVSDVLRIRRQMIRKYKLKNHRGTKTKIIIIPPWDEEKLWA